MGGNFCLVVPIELFFKNAGIDRRPRKCGKTVLLVLYVFFFFCEIGGAFTNIFDHYNHYSGHDGGGRSGWKTLGTFKRWYWLLVAAVYSRSPYPSVAGQTWIWQTPSTPESLHFRFSQKQYLFRFRNPYFQIISKKGNKLLFLTELKMLVSYQSRPTKSALPRWNADLVTRPSLMRGDLIEPTENVDFLVCLAWPGLTVYTLTWSSESGSLHHLSSNMPHALELALSASGTVPDTIHLGSERFPDRSKGLLRRSPNLLSTLIPPQAVSLCL